MCTEAASAEMSLLITVHLNFDPVVGCWVLNVPNLEVLFFFEMETKFQPSAPANLEMLAVNRGFSLCKIKLPVGLLQNVRIYRT
jgi:hypothetical protein